MKWYHLNETSIDAYKASKLRPLLVSARLMMSNAFLLLGDGNLTNYVKVIEDLKPARFEIPKGMDALRNVRNFAEDPRAEDGERVLDPLFKQTLFRLQVGLTPEPEAPKVEEKKDDKKGKKGGKDEKAPDAPPPPARKYFEYTTKPEDFKKAVVTAFVNGVESFKGVHSVESVLLPHLIRDDHLDPNFSGKTAWVASLQKRAEAACAVQEPWLEEFLAKVEDRKSVV